METATKTVNPIIGYVIIALIVAFFIYRKFLKKKPSKGKQKQTNSTPSSQRQKNTWYGDDRNLISISRFQKVVYDRFVVVDLETTGLDPDHDRIVEVAAVRVVNSQITEKYHQLVNPGIPMPEEAMKIHHITDDMLKGQPPINDVLSPLLDFIGSDIPAAHNAGFDSRFLKSACQKYHFEAPKEWFDTMRLTVYWPNLPNRKLESFLKAAGIKNKNAHRSLDDAVATAELIIKSFDKVKK